MDGLILEISSRGLNRYYPIDGEVTTIGRALDNDIILSDQTVDNYQLKIIRREDESLELINLAQTNRTRLDKQLFEAMKVSALPINIDLGRVQARILSRNQAIEPTRAIMTGSRGFKSLFAHAGWAMLLIVGCLVVGGLDFYFNSFNGFKWGELFSFLMRETLLSLSAIILALLVLERLLVHRWEVRQIIASVCLVYLLFYLSSVGAGFLSYLVSSNWPVTLLHFIWYLAIVPCAIALYLIHLTHLKRVRSMALALLIASPIVLPPLLQSAELRRLITDFSPSAIYSNRLSSLNWHLASTVSIDDFIEQATQLKAGKKSD